MLSVSIKAARYCLHFSHLEKEVDWLLIPLTFSDQLNTVDKRNKHIFKKCTTQQPWEFFVFHVTLHEGQETLDADWTYNQCV